MGKKARIGVVGCGRQSDLAFFPWFAGRRDAVLAGVADLNGELALRAVRKYGAERSFTDWERMYDDCGLDAVIVCTPPWVHAGPVVEAARRGLHVLCEKPMAVSVEDCEEMKSAADKAGTMLRIGFSLRFDPGYEALKTIIKNGEIGEVFQLRSTYDGWVPDLSDPFVKSAMEVIEKTKIFPPGLGAWRMNDTRAGGVYTDHAIHYIDMFRWIMEREAVSVSGVAQRVVESRTNEDHASSVLRFEGGACAYIQASLARFSARGSCDEGLIHGTKGCVKYKMDQTWYVLGYPHLYNTHARVWKFGAPSFVLNRWLPEHVEHGRRHCMFKRQFDDFVSRVNGTHEPHPVFGDRWGADADDGLKSVRVVRAFYESAGGGGEVAL